jgi:hypothetical protein
MKTMTITGGAFIIAALLAVMAYGEDYTTKSTEDLARIRSSIHDAPQAEQDAFNKEWNSRLRGMSDDQRRSYLGTEAFDDGRGSGRGSGGGEAEVRGREDELRGGEMELRGRAQEGEGGLRGDDRSSSGRGGEGSSSGSSGSGKSGGSGGSGKGGGKKGGK